MKMRPGMVAFATLAVLSVGAGNVTATAGPPGVSGTSASGVVAAPSGDQADQLRKNYEKKADKVKEKAEKRITQQDRDAAAARALQDGALNPLMVEAAAAPLIDGAPHYFSHPNYANSPLPELVGATVPVGNPLQDRAYATDFPVQVGELAPVLVVLPQELPAGMLTAFETWNQAGAGQSDFPSAGNVFHAYVLRPTGVANEFTVMFDSGPLAVPALADPAVSEKAVFGVANLPVQPGDRLAFYGQGIPVDTGTGTDVLHYPAAQPLQDSAITLGSTDYPVYPQLRTYSFGAQVQDTSGTNQVVVDGTGIRKFVDELPQVGAETGPSIPAAVADTTTYPGSSYYEIALVEYEQKMHTDLPATKLRGYVQLDTSVVPGDGVALTGVDGSPILLPNGTPARGVTQPNYLGPAIVTAKDKPVRILFRNLLPTGAAGNLFIPTDTTVMGSGLTADGHTMDPTAADPQNPVCSGIDKADHVAMNMCYAENRATLHLHGGITPWISDGTPHQWITPAGETTEYPEGVSVENVPDMPDPGPGAQTFFYTNAQSARLMFYHDHAWGITRLNVYAGEAAPYIITDATEEALVNTGVLPPADDTIELVVQDKTFVPDQAQLDVQDETWDSARWGDKGDLWVPHVYSPAQNPGDASGVNAYGRWAYGPWFWPPTNSIDHGPIDNPYYDPNCDPDLTWCEPPKMPGTPYLSMGMESFNDTPVVNGVAYPTLTVDPKAYRFRVLNAANDRFFNLSLYQAVDADGNVCDQTNPAPAPEVTDVACTEVALNPDEVAAALEDTTVFPTPLANTAGPSWIHIGTEGGFVPTPTVVPPQPTTWVNDPTVFNAGNVDKHSLLVAPAERHDVVVDLSPYAGQTLILYNDAPAAFPARDPRYDYYTGNADLRGSGGAPSTLAGYGPNTRTVMQIKVADTAPAAPYDLARLQTAFKSVASGGQGVFESGQKPIIVGQGAYNGAYGTTFQNNGPSAGLAQIYDTSITFDRLVDDGTPGAPYATSTPGQRLTLSMKPKMIQDEMGEAFEHEYGRMSGFLGVETPNAQAGQQNMILSPYTFPPTEIIDGVELPPGVQATPIASQDDGTQIWKFTHNGVDTHPIHFHLYDVQLLNRVGWDGIIRKPDPTELGWKDTVRISPLEDTIVALRAIIPPVPQAWGGLPNSIRLLDPSMPEGAYIENTTAQEAAGLPIFAFNPDGEPIDVVNHYVNFGWEYVLHCHILSHEEMDMMHAQIVGIAPTAPTGLTFTRVGNGNQRRYELVWTDTSKNETGFVIERRAGTTGPWSTLATVPSERLGVVPYADSGVGSGTGPRTYTDRIGNTNTVYQYQVYAINTVGDVWDYSNPAFNNIPPGGGFPTLTLDSRGGAGQPSLTTVATPSNVTASAVAAGKKRADVTVTWTDNATNETGFLVQRSTTSNFSLNVVNATVSTPTTTLTQALARGQTYYYRVLAYNDTHQSGWSNTATVTTP
ncbi:multicopper oxidase domain-containing protein [Ornithinimicrobium cerasi]|uniref:multicopper oxidase domain-containing protein n=1 Tax=Ornithinimicrobium cerasi TaxID=2248773 RepID=UPI00192A5A6E|nr:multicopper oxidase domain-containing protein [Ornithinimicrobium cerasi]